MNPTIVKNNLKKYKGCVVHFKYNGSRNQIEEFNSTIENMYNAIFTIKIKDTNSIKSFTYNDLITESLQIFI